MTNININQKIIPISENKVYYIPQDIIAKNINNYLLLISPSHGNWLLIENQIQANIAKLLYKKYSIKEVKNYYALNDNDQNLIYIIKQIEGKHIELTPQYNDNNFSVRLYVTNKCNLKCNHCFMYSGKSLKNELTFIEIKNLLENCKKYGCNKIILSGGEISTRKDIIDIIKLSKNLGLYTLIMTNGTLWNNGEIKEISEYIDEVQISIDGYDEYTNSQIRGKNTFQKALNTADEFFKTKNILLDISITPLYNILEKGYKKYIEFGKQLIDRYDNNNFLIIFTKDLLNGRNIKANKNKNEKMSEIIDKINEEIYPNFELTNFILRHKYNEIHKNCGFGGLTISANGDYYFCGRILEAKCYGNIRNVEIENIIEYRKKIRKLSNVDYIIPCNKCDLKYICGGGCRLSNINNINNINLFENTNINLSRECTTQEKEKIYKLMINSNDFLVW